jgi:hypothetical protein
MKYVWQNVIHVPKYFEAKIDSKNYSNNYWTLWNIYTYVDYELIVLFKFHIQKIWFIWFHKKNLNEMFHSNQCKHVKKIKNCWKIILIWKVARIMLKILCQIFTLCVSQNARWNQLSQNNIYTNVCPVAEGHCEVPRGCVFFFPFAVRDRRRKLHREGIM